MTPFEEWADKVLPRNFNLSQELAALYAWNAALDEAIKELNGMRGKTGIDRDPRIAISKLQALKTDTGETGQHPPRQAPEDFRRA